ncbi:catabolic 3-dehydroquinase [Colletotrichum graminicola M1.001]|uniref:Catabolic 3-dehydroquinase n=1 Tax=Colletotrichum graminicola (strain M1.001 / M2 / FGSC 10212) TaxID=645133 RepID=E3QX17_COLGM|nr:catabolic 3-dehydroquinase [Colletotrichum graminicola M1.001]EFQ35405.1 catabolic 3-dehydroquinase [Colletotrichum graminicola M1.001]
MTDPHTRQYSHIGGSPAELLDRLAVSELCKGWPTTWSGALPIDDFIRISIEGKKMGDFIMHRECGTLVELNLAANRAVGKMKATITQRFKHRDGFEYDVDCDCRFIFFCEREKVGRCKGGYERRDWKAAFVKLVYEKDKVVPVDGTSAPAFADEVLARYPTGYKYLGAAQSTLGYDIDVKLVTGQDLGSCEKMYRSIESWLAGEQGAVGLFY